MPRRALFAALDRVPGVSRAWMQLGVIGSQRGDLQRDRHWKTLAVAPLIDEQRVEILFAAVDSGPQLGNAVRDPRKTLRQFGRTRRVWELAHPRDRRVEQHRVCLRAPADDGRRLPL